MDKHRGEMQQQVLPLAFVRGEKVTEKPKDLFIPEQALEVHLSTFEGPLALLLYLTKKQKFDIADLPIAPISQQYLHYLELMKEQGISLVAEYLVMAATLAEIKSRLLLPKPELETFEDDPRAELMQKLQEYQRMKQAANLLRDMPQVGKDTFVANIQQAPNLVVEEPAIDIALSQLVSAYQSVLKQQAALAHHHIAKEAISTRDKMQHILATLAASCSENMTESFAALLDISEGKQGVVVTFLAVLELIKEGKLACQLNEKSQTFYLSVAA